MTSSTQPSLTPCPECGGERVLAHLQGPVVVVPEHPSLLDHFKHQGLRATVCTVCGYLTFYTYRVPEGSKAAPMA